LAVFRRSAGAGTNRCARQYLGQPLRAMWCSATPARWGWRGDCFEAAGIAFQIRTLSDWLKFNNPNAPVVKREPEEGGVGDVSGTRIVDWC
jgi:hypothetical protein